MEQEIAPFDQLLRLDGQTAIVTGGAMGIGLGIVTRLAQAGANVMIVDWNEEAAWKSANSLSSQGMRVKAVKVDVSNEGDVYRMVALTVNEFGGLNIIVNNAGIYPQIP